MKKFVSVEIKIIRFVVEDLVRTSGWLSGAEDGDNDYGWGENM